MNTHQAFPFPLGATLTNTGCNFAVHHDSAFPLSLIIFKEDGSYTEHSFTEEYGTIKYTHLTGIKEGAVYGFKIIKNEEDLLLLDPYAKALKKHSQLPSSIYSKTKLVPSASYRC